jgi:hypothetical protein
MALGAGGVRDGSWHCGAPYETPPERPIGSWKTAWRQAMTRDIPLFPSSGLWRHRWNDAGDFGWMSLEMIGRS